MGAVVLDTSVLLAALDPQDAHHHSAAERLRAHRDGGDSFIVSAIVLAEALIAESRRGEPAVDERRAAIRKAFGPTRPIDDPVAVDAAALRSAHPTLPLPDALVIAVGRVDRVAVILTADHRWSGVDDRVELVT